MIGPSSTTPLPGIVSQYNDRLGRIYGPDTLEANWYEERLQREGGVLNTKGEAPVLRHFEPELSAHQREISGDLGIASRIQRHPFMFKSRSVVSDGLNERVSMSETFFAPLDKRPANPVGAGRTTSHDQMLQRFAQHDEPKTRQSKDRMSNIEHEVRPIADSEEKVRKKMIDMHTLRHLDAHRPSVHSARSGFGSVVPSHPEGHDARSFETTTGHALSTGRDPPKLEVSAATPRALRSWVRDVRAPRRVCAHGHDAPSCTRAPAPLARAVAQRHQMPPRSSIERGASFANGGYEKGNTDYTVFPFGHAREAAEAMHGGGKSHYGKKSVVKIFQEANNPPSAQVRPGRPQPASSLGATGEAFAHTAELDGSSGDVALAAEAPPQPAEPVAVPAVPEADVEA